MTTLDAAAPARFRIGKVLGRMFRILFGPGFFLFFILGMFARVPLDAVLAFGVDPAAPAGAARLLSLFSARALPYTIPAFLVSLAISAIVQAAVTHDAISLLSGRQRSLGSSLATGLRVFLPMIGISLIVAVAAGFGFLVLVVPGVMLLLRWLVAIPARIIEGPGILVNLERSMELTRGHSWAILGVYVLYLLIVLIGSTVLGALGALAGVALAGSDALRTVTFFVELIVSGFSVILGAAMPTSIYYELRMLKEGVAADGVANVFA